MATIDVKIPKSLYRKLDPKEYDKALMRGMSDATKEVQKEAQVYPNKRPGQRYIRTYALRRSWGQRKIRRTSNGVEGIVYSNVNTAPYNVWVQHPRYQAGVHRGRWQTTDDIARKKQRDVGRIFEREIKRALK